MYLGLSQSRKGSSSAKFLGSLQLTLSLSPTTVGLYKTTCLSSDSPRPRFGPRARYIYIYIYVDEYLWTLRPHKSHIKFENIQFRIISWVLYIYIYIYIKGVHKVVFVKSHKFLVKKSTEFFFFLKWKSHELCLRKVS